MRDPSLLSINMAKKEGKVGHVVVVPYPSQGHINPMLQFCKRLSAEGLTTTLAITRFISTATSAPLPSSSVRIATISDGCDISGFAQADSVHDYIRRLEAAGSESLTDLIRNSADELPVTCVVYDAFLPWALDVAKALGVVGAAFFTQNCVVNYLYYKAHKGLLELPLASLPVSVPGLPPFNELRDMPSFIQVYGSYPAYFDFVLNQFSNTHKADFLLFNSVYEFERLVVEAMSKVCRSLTIGPTIPSKYLDKTLESDQDYGLSLFTTSDNSTWRDWLSCKPPGSVLYVSFGSLSNLSTKQTEELSWGLIQADCYFIWAIRSSEQHKIPPQHLSKYLRGSDINDNNNNKGLVISWSPQLEVLESEAIGCFLTHCGWNSTLEALCLGVPMVAMPQWTDQTTNGKLVEDVWGVGVRVKVGSGDGIVGRDEIEFCVKEVMEGERAKDMKENAIKWKEVAIRAVSNGGSSHSNIHHFVSMLK